MKHPDEMNDKEFELFLYDDLIVTSLPNNYKEVRIQRYEPSIWGRIIISLNYIVSGKLYMMYTAPDSLINRKVNSEQN